jgi:hypothetical protein
LQADLQANQLPLAPASASFIHQPSTEKHLSIEKCLKIFTPQENFFKI